jgi:hypothetical protein
LKAKEKTNVERKELTTAAGLDEAKETMSICSRIHTSHGKERSERNQMVDAPNGIPL